MTNKSRKPWIAGLFTLIVIGLGHIYAGKAKRGIILFFIGLFIYSISLPILILPIIPINILLLVSALLIFKVFCIIDAVRFSKQFKHSYILKKYNKWYIYLIYCIITSIVVEPLFTTGIKNNIVQAYKIPAGSMKSTLLIGDHIFVNKLIYKNSEPARGDIIVFPLPEDTSKDFIKRIVGIGGDLIEIKNKQVFINGSELNEIYKLNSDDRIIPEEIQPRDNFKSVRVPRDSLFVMGDNRDHSYDSRFWGFVKKSDVKGKAISIYWSWDRENLKIRWNRIGNKIQ